MNSYASVLILRKKGIKVETVSGSEMNFKKLLMERIDLVTEDFFVGYNFIHKLFDPPKAALFTNNPVPLQQKGAFMLISKSYPGGKALAEKLDRGLKKLKASGRYQSIIDDFMNTK